MGIKTKIMDWSGEVSDWSLLGFPDPRRSRRCVATPAVGPGCSCRTSTTGPGRVLGPCASQAPVLDCDTGLDGEGVEGDQCLSSASPGPRAASATSATS